MWWMAQRLDNAENKEEKESVILEFQRQLRITINPRNLRRYVESFLKYFIFETIFVLQS